ncbi:aldo/keto reductase [Nonomuraea sp. NPDC003201]
MSLIVEIWTMCPKPCAQVGQDLLGDPTEPNPPGVVVAPKAGTAHTGPGLFVPVGRPAYLKQQGKVRCIILSEVSVEQLKEARWITEIASVQNLYNLVNRQSQAVLDYATAEGFAFIPWPPIATGRPRPAR